MNDGKTKSRFVYAKRPTHPRLGQLPAPDSSQLSLTAQRRLLKVQSRSRLGPSFYLALGPNSHSLGASFRLPAAAVGALVICVVLAPFAVLSTSVVAGITLGFGACASGLLAWWLQRRARPVAQTALPLTALPIDSQTLLNLDRVVETVAPELPDAALLGLLSLKNTVVRVAGAWSHTPIDENVTMEDRMYVVECLRRYLPDSLTAYLAIPEHQRGIAIEGERLAADVLVDQLALLQQEVERLERKGHRSAGEKLLQQKRFLEAKNRER